MTCSSPRPGLQRFVLRPATVAVRSFSLRLAEAWNDLWNFALILPIFVSKAVNELPFLEREHHESRREHREDQDIYANIVNDESVGNDSDARAEVPRMTYCSIDSILQQLALSMLGA
jgi:hypothetical protein